MKVVRTLLFLIMFSFMFTCKVSASGIENYYINAVVKDNGDLVVEEYFYLNGSFNGMDRTILYRNSNSYPFRPELDSYGGSELHNGNGIELESIKAVEINSDFKFENVEGILFEEVSSASKGDFGVYTKKLNTNGYTYRIFLPHTEGKAFYMKYTLKNMGILHNDIGELFWNVIGDELSESIGTLKVTVHFPNNSSEFRVWAHGPLNGKVKKIANDTLYAEITNLAAYKAVDIRAVFDREVISKSTKLSNVNALDKILNYEEDVSNQANYERAQLEYKRQREAYELLASCKKSPNRSCYGTLKSRISLINDKEVKEALNKELEELYLKVVAEEERIAVLATEYAEEYPKYVNYQKAKKDVAVLTNYTLKKSLENRLEVVENNIRLKEQEIQKCSIVFSILLILFLVILFLYLYYKCDKDSKPDFQLEYMREFPDHFSPSTVSYLFDKKITNKAIGAEIMYLIHKKVVFMEKIETNKKDYIFRKNKDFQGSLSAKENALMTFLFQEKDEITLKSFKAKAKSASYSFLRKWNNVQDEAMNEALEEKLYVDDYKKTIKSSKGVVSFYFIFMFLILWMTPFWFLALIGLFVYLSFTLSSKKAKALYPSLEGKIKKVCKTLVVLFLIMTTINMIIVFMNSHYDKSAIIYIVIVFIFCFLLLIYIPKIKKRTVFASNEYAKWRAFKHFLEDFGNFEMRELPEVALWEKYLVYAVVLGCADKLAEVMKIKVQDMDVNTSNFDIGFVSQIVLFPSVVSASVNTAHSVERASSSSNFSSGSGGGGGFSSGGGSGGGGGGGGRF